MDFFNQGIPLGRWFRITVVIHWTFIFYVADDLFLNRDPGQSLGDAVLYTVLLFGTVLLHEFGHALSCRAVGGEADHIVLWPLGGLAFVQPPMKPFAWLVTTACGPLVNAVLWPLFWFLTFHWPFGFPQHPTPLFTAVWGSCWYMYQINRYLLLFNLIPAYPMDGGRLLQEILWFFVGYAKSMRIAGMVGTVAGVGLIVLGLGLWKVTIPGVDFTIGGGVDTMLAVIGLLAAMMSFGIYRRAEEIKSWRKN